MEEDILPPEAPVKAKKEGFFARLGKKKETPRNKINPDIELNLPPLPEISDMKKNDLDELRLKLQMPEQKPELITKEPIERAPEITEIKEVQIKKEPVIIAKNIRKEKLDWTQTEDELNIKDKKESDWNAPVEEVKIKEPKIEIKKQEILTTQIPLPKLPELPPLEQLELPPLPEMPKLPETSEQMKVEVPETPGIHPEINEHFENLEKEHEELRKELHEKIKNPRVKIDKEKAAEILQKHSEKIVKKIHEKKAELDEDKKYNDAMFDELKNKEEHMKSVMKHLRAREKAVKEKENSLIERETALNENQKNFEEIIKKRTEKERQALEREKIKYAGMENKLVQREKLIQKEKDGWENKKKSSLALLRKADVVAKQRNELLSIRKTLTQEEQTIKKELDEEEDIKKEIEEARTKLEVEKKDTENLQFKKYIEDRLKEIKPIPMKELHEDEEDVEVSVIKHKEFYDMIDECRSCLRNNEIKKAQSVYTNLKNKFYDSKLEGAEKMLIYNYIREIYNDIQLAKLNA